MTTTKGLCSNLQSLQSTSDADGVEYWELVACGGADEEEEEEEGEEDEQEKVEEDEEQGEESDIEGGHHEDTVAVWERQGHVQRRVRGEDRMESSDSVNGNRVTIPTTTTTTTNTTTISTTLPTHEIFVFAACARRRPFIATPLTLDAVNAPACITSLFDIADLSAYTPAPVMGENCFLAVRICAFGKASVTTWVTRRTGSGGGGGTKLYYPNRGFGYSWNSRSLEGGMQVRLQSEEDWGALLDFLELVGERTVGMEVRIRLL